MQTHAHIPDGTHTDEFGELVSLFVGVHQRSLFGLFPDDDIRSLLTHSVRIESYRSGELIRQTSPTGELVILGSGRVSTVDKNDDSKILEELTSGKSIELDAFIQLKRHWRFRWRALTDIDILRIDGPMLRALFQKHPTILSYLERVVASPEIQKLKNDMRLFGFNHRARAQIIGALSSFPETPFPEESLLILVREGTLSVVSQLGKVPSHLTTLNAGHYTLITPDQPRITLVPSPDARCWFVSGKDFKGLAGSALATTFLEAINWNAANDRFGEPRPTLEINHAPPPAGEESNLSVDNFLRAESKVRRRRGKIPHVRQHDQMDCGAACLAIVARHFGKQLSLADARSHVHVTRDGASMRSLKSGASSLGLESIGAFSKVKGLRDLCTPFIALLQYHFVVLFEVGEKDVLISCPARGVFRQSITDFSREFSGNILLLRPTERFASVPESKPSYRRYAAILRSHYNDIGILAFASGVLFSIGLAQPVVSQFLFDSVLIQKKYGLLTLIMLATITISLFSLFGTIARNYLANHLTSQLDAKFSALFVRHVFALPLEYFMVRRVGDITSRMGELLKIRHFLAAKPIVMILNVFSIFIYGGFLAAYSFPILGIVFVQTLILAAILWVSLPKLTAMARLGFANGAKMTSLFFEQIRGLDTLRSTGGLIAARWRWTQASTESIKLDERITYFHMNMGAVSSTVQQLFSAVLTLESINLFLSGDLTLGQTVAITSLAGQVVSPALALVSEISALSEFSNAVLRVDDVFTARPEMGSGPKERPIISGSIALQDVSFRYGNETAPLVLDRVNFSIQQAERVAIVGGSGSGKTTLAYLLCGLLRPTSGKILWDRFSYDELDLQYIRSQMGVILQDNTIFGGSVLENITAGAKESSFERAMDAARVADAHEFIARLPGGYSTKIGDQGMGLSGGQKQRLCIARAVYRRPPILVMDEATSGLDAISENTIVQNLKRRTGATIVIAHRLNTVISCDRIIVMQAGRIVEGGTHVELLTRRSHYWNLFRRQFSQT